MIPSSELAAFLEDLKDQLNITSSKHDAELLGKLEAAFEVAESVAGRAMYPGSATELVTAVGVLKHYPVQTATATYLGAPAAVTVSEAGVVSGAYTGTSITYTYGQDEPTAAQREGVLLIAAHLWETQRAPSTAGPLGDDDTGFAPGYGFAVPNRARDLLRPPAAVSGIA